jgi:two-component system, cell cycle response regulator DivK
MTQVILVVEDNERNRKLVRTILKFRGFTVVECEDGESALGLAKQHRPVLVLMDIELPKIDGIAALGILRAHPETSAIPVVAVTASVTSAERERVTTAGFDGYLAKPIDIDEFNRTVDRFVAPGGAPA